MIARVPILLEPVLGDEEMGPFHDIFKFDQKKVYDILFTIFSTNEDWVYSKLNRKEKRRRKLFLAVYVHYVGPNKVDQNLDFHREKKSWNFEKYQADR